MAAGGQSWIVVGGREGPLRGSGRHRGLVCASDIFGWGALRRVGFDVFLLSQFPNRLELVLGGMDLLPSLMAGLAGHLRESALCGPLQLAHCGGEGQFAGVLVFVRGLAALEASFSSGAIPGVVKPKAAVALGDPGLLDPSFRRVRVVEQSEPGLDILPRA